MNKSKLAKPKQPKSNNLFQTSASARTCDFLMSISNSLLYGNIALFIVINDNYESD